MKDTDGESLSSSLGRRLSLANRNCFENTWELYDVQDFPTQKTKKAQRRSQLRSVSFETDPNQTLENRNEAEQNDISAAPPDIDCEQPSTSSSAACGTASLPNSKMEPRKRQSKPRMLLMGQRRSGKSSITSVVFHKMEPQETLFLESTTRIQKDTMNSFMDFQVWDFPGQLDYFDPTFDTTGLFSDIGALIWVVDAQDEYLDSLGRLTTTIINLQNTFPHINVEVFVHKTDSLNEDLRSDIFQDIVQRVTDDLNDAGFINPNVSYHLTSIYDSSIFEALSSVIQKLVPELDVLQNLLNTLINNSGMTKAYLFDILSKIYVASDTRPVDSDIYEICANYIDLTVDFTDLYNYPRDNPKSLGEQMTEVESSMTFADGTMVYIKEMSRTLALVTVIKNKEAKEKKGMIDYNVHIFQEALKAVFDRAWEKQDDAAEHMNGGAALENETNSDE